MIRTKLLAANDKKGHYAQVPRVSSSDFSGWKTTPHALAPFGLGMLLKVQQCCSKLGMRSLSEVCPRQQSPAKDFAGLDGGGDLLELRLEL